MRFVRTSASRTSYLLARIRFFPPLVLFQALHRHKHRRNRSQRNDRGQRDDNRVDAGAGLFLPVQGVTVDVGVGVNVGFWRGSRFWGLARRSDSGLALRKLPCRQ